MKISVVSVCLGLLCCLIACENEVSTEELNFNIQTNLVLHGGVIDGQIYFSVKKTQSVIDKGLLKPVTKLESFVYCNNIIIDTLTRYEEADSMRGELFAYDFYYKSPAIKPGNVYKLKILVNGFDTISAQASPLDTVPIKFLGIKYLYKRRSINYYQITFSIIDPEMVRNEYSLYCEGYNKYHQTNVGFHVSEDNSSMYCSFDDASIVNGKFQLILMEDITNGRANKVVFELNQSDTLGDLYSSTSNYQQEMSDKSEYYAFEPINVYTNVTNGYGFFAGGSLTTKDSINLEDLFPDVK